MEDYKRTVLEEKVYKICGTTKLNIYDPMYSQKGTNYEFIGNISAAPIGLLRIRKAHLVYPSYDLEFDHYEVDVFQGSNNEQLNVYLKDRFYTKAVKKECDLNCETGQYVIETKWGSDLFKTCSDGTYGHLWQMKQYYGCVLKLFFDDDLFTFEELEERFLKLFKERKAA